MMNIADCPDNEVDRIKALHSLEILDTQAEERFDRLTRLAAHIFRVPISLVSFVDVNRQWFKSCVGLNVQETEREVSFCAHAILEEDTFIIEDASKDPRFFDNPLVTEPPYIRFYVGRVLKAPQGEKLGTLCIIDDKPRTVSADELAILEDLAKMAEEELYAVNTALLDELTQISNYRGFMSLAEKSLHICKRRHIPVSIVFFDLNKFKDINDNHGHAEGDTALQKFAAALKETFRDSDVIARMGGDEFAVFLTDAHTEDTQESIKRLQNALNKINQSSNKAYEIGFSSGLVTTTDDSETLKSLLDRADKAMYENKLETRSNS